LKLCPFAWTLRYFAKEVRAYNTLRDRGCFIIPTIHAFVFERSEEQVIGFICDGFEGLYPELDDYEACKRGLQQFHSYGIVHGDVNKFNFIVTAEGIRLFDLETSTLDIDEGVSEQDFKRLQEEELEILKEKLCDPEEWGKPWEPF
ncbi:hypothetical protein K402DRAFT_333479, partial [Aulographum hederae CBS 113979]